MGGFFGSATTPSAQGRGPQSHAKSLQVQAGSLGFADGAALGIAAGIAATGLGFGLGGAGVITGGDAAGTVDVGSGSSWLMVGRGEVSTGTFTR